MSKAKPVAKTQKKKLQKTKDRYRAQLESVLSETEVIEAESGNHNEDDSMRTRLADAESALVKAAAQLAMAKESPQTDSAAGDRTEDKQAEAVTTQPPPSLRGAFFATKQSPPKQRKLLDKIYPLNRRLPRRATPSSQ